MNDKDNDLKTLEKIETPKKEDPKNSEFSISIEADILPNKRTTKEERVLKKRRENLSASVNSSKNKVRKQRTTEISRNKIKDLEISQMKPDYEMAKEGVGVPHKITPDMEKVLFAYYLAGASLNQIYRQFGDQLGFGLNALCNARDFYLWEQRKASISNLVSNDNVLKIADKFKDYLSFLDSLISDAMIRFTDNSQSGRNNNPFNTLKVTGINDLKTVMELMINLSQGGVKHFKVATKDFTEKESTEKGYQKLSDKKAQALLEILAKSEDEIDEDKKE
jgi:hypothetical protein